MLRQKTWEKPYEMRVVVTICSSRLEQDAVARDQAVLDKYQSRTMMLNSHSSCFVVYRLAYGLQMRECFPSPLLCQLKLLLLHCVNS